MRSGPRRAGIGGAGLQGSIYSRRRSWEAGTICTLLEGEHEHGRKI